MNLLHYIFWALVGAALAFVILKSQSWSVRLIHPDRKKLSQWIIVGGAFIRWSLVFLLFSLALKDSFIALMVVFISFTLSRLLMLFRLQSIVQIKSSRVKSME